MSLTTYLTGVVSPSTPTTISPTVMHYIRRLRGTCPPGTRLEVRGDSKLVRLYNRGILANVHPRQPRGGRSTDPKDYPKELTAYTLRSPNYMCHRLAELGDDVGVFAEKLFSGPTPWSKLRQGQKMLRLGERYTPARLNTACHRALTVELIDVRRLEHILVEALEEEAMDTIGSSTSPSKYCHLSMGFIFTLVLPKVPLRRIFGVLFSYRSAAILPA